MRQFQEKTRGHHLIMGRKTFESIGHPLPHRVNIVVSRNPDYRPVGVTCVASFEEALAYVQPSGDSEVFVIGGAEIYRAAINRASRVYLTRVHTTIDDGDTFFNINEREWLEDSREEYPANERNEFAFTVLTLDAK